MGYRVIQWSTGHVGALALHGVISHPDLDLVGLWVHDPAKVGRDAGELCGLDPVGVAATDDVDALLDLGADCVCYTATADLRPDAAVDDLCRILASGANVVSSSLVQLLHPPTGDAPLASRLTEACQEGGTSCLFSGIDPGVANDLLPIVASGLCERIDDIRIQEILDYATYDQPEVLFDTMGFGHPLDHTPLLLIPGALGYAWGGAIGQIAEALDVTVDEITESHERAAVDRDLTVAGRRVPAGTMSGLRFEVRGMVGGRAAIVVEHVTRLADDVAPHWPSGHGQGFYRIRLSGSPTITLDLEMVGEDGDHNTGGLVVTAMRLLNAVPAVCAAEPGLLSGNDLPITAGRHLLSP